MTIILCLVHFSASDDKHDPKGTAHVQAPGSSSFTNSAAQQERSIMHTLSQQNRNMYGKEVSLTQYCHGMRPGVLHKTQFHVKAFAHLFPVWISVEI